MQSGAKLFEPVKNAHQERQDKMLREQTDTTLNKTNAERR